MNLFVLCEHGHYERHSFWNIADNWTGPNAEHYHPPIVTCPGGRQATHEDLIEALGGEKVWLCIERPLAKEAAVSNMPGDKDWCFFQGEPPHLPDCGWRVLVVP